jgi:hypothetical protein
VNDVEQAIVALVIDDVRSFGSKKFSGTISELRDAAVGDYEIDHVPNAFENAFNFLVERGLAKIHHHPPLQDYISIDQSSAQSVVLFDMIAGETIEQFSFGNSGTPVHKVLASYLELGSDWLHELAAALGANEPTPDQIIHSASWTGHYSVSGADQLKIEKIFVEMRAEIGRLEMSNAERSNALAALSAAEALMSAADPAWSLIMKILGSPVLGNVAAMAAVIITLIKG